MPHTPSKKNQTRLTTASQKNEEQHFTFSGQYAQEAKREIQKYPKDRQQSAVLALLDLAQRQNSKTRCITPQAIVAIASMLKMPEIRVFEIATFYSMFRLQPSGKYHLQICGTTPCMLCGAQQIKRAILDHLGLQLGETSQDHRFTVTEVECVGACVNAPVIQVNDDFVENLTIETALELLNELKEDKTEKLKRTANPVALPLGEDPATTDKAGS